MSCKRGKPGVGLLHAKPFNQGAIMAATWKTLSGPAALIHNLAPLAPWAQCWDKPEHRSSKSAWSSPITSPQSDSLDSKTVCHRNASNEFPSHCLSLKETRTSSTLAAVCLARVGRLKTVCLNSFWKCRRACQSWQHHHGDMELLGYFQALTQQICKAQWVKNHIGMFLCYVWQSDTE